MSRTKQDHFSLAIHILLSLFKVKINKCCYLYPVKITENLNYFLPLFNPKKGNYSFCINLTTYRTLCYTNLRFREEGL